MNDAMQKFECRELSDAELDHVAGGATSVLSDIAQAVADAALNPSHNPFGPGRDAPNCSLKDKQINRFGCGF